MNFQRLSEIADIVMGQSPPSSSYNLNGEGLPFFQGKADFSYLSPKVRVFCSQPLKIAEPNDILISVRAPVGPTNLNTVRSCIGRGLAAIRCREDVYTKFILYFLRFNEGKLTQIGKGSTFEAINRDDLETIQVPLPSLSEQKHIAAILEKADRLRRQRCYALELSDTFLRSVFLKMFGDPIVNPMKWSTEQLGNLGDGENAIVDGPFGSSVDTSVDYIPDGEIPVIRTKNVRPFEFVTDDLKFMSREKFELVKRSKVIPGDIVLTKVGTIGNVCIFPPIFEEAVLSTTGSCKITPDNQKVDTIYLARFLYSLKEHLNKIASEGVQPFLNMKTIKELVVCLPPRTLQEEFANISRQSDRLRMQQREAERQAEHLFQTLLHRAFRGELTAREPATVIPFPCHNSVDDRGAILSYIVNSQWQQPTFGHVKCAKFVYLVSAHIGIDLGGEQRREAAGPLADFFYSVEKTAEEKGWFYTQKRRTEGYSYQPGPNISERIQAAIEILGERKEKLDKLLKDLAGVKSDEIEVAATLFAAWNDFLIDGHQPTDEEIIREALENWHPDKKLKRLFNPIMLKTWLKWMREIKLTPEGIGPRTVKKI
jgi:type I restriction enzyme, S subunit